MCRKTQQHSLLFTDLFCHCVRYTFSFLSSSLARISSSGLASLLSGSLATISSVIASAVCLGLVTTVGLGSAVAAPKAFVAPSNFFSFRVAFLARFFHWSFERPLSCFRCGVCQLPRLCVKMVRLSMLPFAQLQCK